MKKIVFDYSTSGKQSLPITFWALILLVALAGLAAGCVFIPTPHYYANGSRQNVTAQSTNLIPLCADTIEDVILKLGEPDAVSPDEQRIAYAQKKVVGQLIVFGVDTDGSDLPDVTRYRFLNVMLDDKGVVTNREFSNRQISMLVGSIGGEPIKMGFECWWYPGIDVGRPPQQGEPFKMVAGKLLLTDSSIYFFEEHQWLNDRPTLNLPYKALAECWPAKDYFESPSLVVRLKGNHFQSFGIRDWGRSAQKAVDSSRNLIESKLNSTDWEK